ncbi:uncharacterized protein J4E79_010154 [Alternaria viburni]|uniref:uncharacterized protein n=1 Tax=Alternaria viburni TaxID=566460 RepID=UPI0020C4E3CD|nr:uncharacterized protein J4E79_010154 [Alternaria viburni]KAI4648532.1 hypothetical protein J4E79_010154 [Alternaria viburni]
MDEKAKNRKFTLFRLNTHLRGSTHSRETELRRALKNDGKDKTSLIACPVCKLLVKDQLWEDLEDESEEEEVLTSEFEGFSDAEDEQRNAMTGVE